MSGLASLGFRLFIPAFSFMAPAYAGVIHVDGNSPGPARDGLTWCTAYTQLQDGLAASAAGDEIRVAAGTYKPDRGTGDRLATFRLESGVVVRGGYAGCGASDPDARDAASHPSILSGDLNGNDGPDFVNYAENSYHVVTYADGNATGVILDGFTISSGNADGTGPTGTITNQGGGIHIRDDNYKCIPGGPTVRNCTIEKNRAAHHGAVNDHAAASVFENCTFRDNYAGEEGAGLLIHHGRTQVRNCTFERNVTDADGGGVWVGKDYDQDCSWSPAPRFIACRFVQNSARRGGGFFGQEYSSPALFDCVFDDNLATFSGGGLHLDAGDIVIHGTRFLNNIAEGDATGAPPPGGGGIWLRTLGAHEAVITDSEFRGNTAKVGGGIMASTVRVRATRVVFAQNTAEIGGGGGLWVSGFASVSDSAFLGNVAANDGGGLAADRDTNVTLIRSTLVGNVGDGFGGGGVSLYAGTEGNIVNCRFVGNSFGDRPNVANYGGGILVNGATAVVTNCAFVGNSANRGGGACFANGANGRVTNCTFTENSTLATVNLGAGILSYNSAITVVNSILWDAGPLGPGAEVYIPADEKEPVNIQFNCVKGGWSGTGNFELDPLFSDVTGPDQVLGTEDDDVRLSVDSPCVDTGDNDSLPQDTTDLDGDGDANEPLPVDLADSRRSVGAFVDMGALELGDCNRNGIEDIQELAAGTSPDSDGNGVPDECDQLPVVAPAGCRHVAVGPAPGGEPVALRLTFPGTACPARFVRADGLLTDVPAYLPPEAWATVYVRGAEIGPNTRYDFEAQFEDGRRSPKVGRTTARWGDTVAPLVGGAWPAADGQVDIIDAVACLDVFRHHPLAPPLPWCDLQPVVPDGRVDILEITLILDAFRSRPYPFQVPSCLSG